MKYFLPLLLLWPCLGVAQSRTWSVQTDSLGQFYYMWSDSTALTRAEIRRMDLMPLYSPLPINASVRCFTAGGTLFALSIAGPSLVPYPTSLTQNQLEARLNGMRLFTIGTAVAGAIFIAIGADGLKNWQPVAGLQGVGISIRL